MYEGHDEGELLRSEVEMLVLALPAFPQSVQEIRKIAGNVNGSPRKLVSVVEHDPVLTGHILKLVNSSYFGLPRRITSVKQAVVFIGMNTTKHLALCVAALGALPRANNVGLPFAELRRSAVNTAAVARLISQKVRPGATDSEALFLAGLLHNLGQIALMVHRPDDYREILISAAGDPHVLSDRERDVFGTDRYAVSAMMAWRWQISPLVVDTIRGYANWSATSPRTVQMDILFAATALLAYIEGSLREFALPSATEAALDVTASELLAARGDFEDTILEARVFLDHG